MKEEDIIISATDLCRHVNMVDGQLEILNHVNLQVGRGESLAIVGVSGSGKTTLLSVLAGLDTPTSGVVRLDGTDISSLDEDGRAALRAQRVGFVFQSFQLLPSLTALENVMLPLELGGVANAETAAVAMLTRVGLQSRLKHYPNQLSGGEQQRVAIARAFVVQPALLFADEPTGNLDRATGQTVIELLFELNQERGTTLILVTHDEALASRCGRQIRLEAGSITGQ